MEIIATLYAYRYVGLFLGTFFEGPIVMAAAGFFITYSIFHICQKFFRKDYELLNSEL